MCKLNNLYVYNLRKVKIMEVLIINRYTSNVSNNVSIQAHLVDFEKMQVMATYDKMGYSDLNMSLFNKFKTKMLVDVNKSSQLGYINFIK